MGIGMNKRTITSATVVEWAHAEAVEVRTDDSRTFHVVSANELEDTWTPRHESAARDEFLTEVRHAREAGDTLVVYGVRGLFSNTVSAASIDEVARIIQGAL